MLAQITLLLCVFSLGFDKNTNAVKPEFKNCVPKPTPPTECRDSAPSYSKIEFDSLSAVSDFFKSNSGSKRVFYIKIIPSDNKNPFSDCGAILYCL